MRCLYKMKRWKQVALRLVLPLFLFEEIISVTLNSLLVIIKILRLLFRNLIYLKKQKYIDK